MTKPKALLLTLGAFLFLLSTQSSAQESGPGLQAIKTAEALGKFSPKPYKFKNNDEDNAMSITIQSPAFENNGEIPARFTCEGDDISPALTWSDIPQGTKSLALIVDDPDAPDPAAPKMTWVHWVLYNIPPDTRGLGEAVSTTDLPSGTQQGSNDWKKTGYGGPCPPIGRHRYFFKLYALDIVLPDLNQPTKSDLENAMQGHIIAHSELLGTYKKY